ncbi:hypothetical protein HanPI659440_Chr13g0523261 [Helianthus annuus]|nr:hypothetical protein HanPI659440_Chr13g0523261 [Helianthus annuus]
MHFDLAHCMVWYKMDTLVYPLRVSRSGPTLSRVCHMILVLFMCYRCMYMTLE